LSEAIVIAVSKLVDDAQSGRREPSHYVLEGLFRRAGLLEGDPNSQGETLGKAKRVRAVLTYAIENSAAKGEHLVALLVETLRGSGGFDPSSPNFVGAAPIAAAASAFRAEAYVLASDGVLSTVVLDNLEGTALTVALRAYVNRAKRGVEDAALLVGTAKDLMEATAKHVIATRLGTPTTQGNFPFLLGQAYYALGLATPQDAFAPGEHPRRRLERGLYEAACAVNSLRNQEGTGHGRPWLPSVKPHEARTAVETMGLVAEYLLNCLHPPQ
jgi:hypothetical protein